jgi:hypothetical protein
MLKFFEHVQKSYRSLDSGEKIILVLDPAVKKALYPRFATLKSLFFNVYWKKCVNSTCIINLIMVEATVG